jgi:Saxitoxin biosynthesis operon protein SxtJ
MHWSDAIALPSRRHLRQFAGLCLLFLVGLAARRVWLGRPDVWAAGLAALGVAAGALGLARPQALRWIYTGWMVVAFPIGWAVSRLALALVFYVVITPVAYAFRAAGRDELRLRRSSERSYWRSRPRPANVRDYLRQS